MLVCQCNAISDRQVRQVIRDLLAEDPWAIIVPATVYRALDQRYKCAGCVPNVLDLIAEVTETVHQELAALPPVPEAVKNRSRLASRRRQGGRHERRRTGHRAA